MADFSHLTATEDADYEARSQVAPAPFGEEPGFTAAFHSAFQDNVLNNWTGAAKTQQAQYTQGVLDQYKQATGEDIPNPVTWTPATPQQYGSSQPELFDYARSRLKIAAQKQGDQPDAAGLGGVKLDANALDDDRIINGGIDLARKAGATDAQIQAAGGKAAWLGAMAASVPNPNNAIAMAVPEGGLLMRMLGMGAAFAGGEVLTQASGGFAVHRAVDPNYTAGDAAKGIIEQGAMGAGMELGIKAFGWMANRTMGAAWRAMRGADPRIVTDAPLSVHDDGVVAERAQDLQANNPFTPGDPVGQAAHNDAITRMDEAAAKGQTMEFPASAKAETAARPGEAFVQTAAPDGEAPLASSFFGSGQSVKLRYELAEARDLITSHNADFRTNPDYPAELQPRNRANAPAQAQVQSIYSDFNPERLGPSVEANSGAPIVGPDNIVESGNGRAMALAKVYAENGDRAASYRSFLQRSGFDPEGMQQLVLVGRRVTPMSDADRIAFAHAANGTESLRMTPTERAMSDARHIDSGLLQLHSPDAATGSAANRDFARAFISKLPVGERADLMDSAGHLSADGVRRIDAAMVTNAFSDAGVVERAFARKDPNIKTIASALVKASGNWARMRAAVRDGRIPAGQDITEHLMTAVKSVMRARDEGVPVRDQMAQGDIFTSDTSQRAARLFFKDAEMRSFLARDDMAENLSSFARTITEGTEKGDDLFGAKPPTAQQAVDQVLAQRDRMIAERVAAARSSIAAEKALNDPRLADAKAAQLERDIAQGRNLFVDDAGQAHVADAELHDIQNQEEAAREIAACASPKPMIEAAE